MSPSGSGLYLALAMAELVGGWGWGSNPLSILHCDAPPTQPGYRISISIRYPEQLCEAAPEPGTGFRTHGQSARLSYFIA